MIMITFEHFFGSNIRVFNKLPQIKGSNFDDYTTYYTVHKGESTVTKLQVLIKI